MTFFYRCVVSQLEFLKLPLSGSAAGKQQVCDKAVMDAEFSALVNCYTDPSHKARLLAAAAARS